MFSAAMKSGPNEFSRKAFMTRANAAIFNGQANSVQLKCLKGFLSLYLIYNRVFGYHIPASWLAYVLATVYHETAATMLPIEEYGKGHGRPYGEPDPVTGQVYYGRGYVQLTWKDNYQKAQDVVFDIETLERGGVPFVNSPDLSLLTLNAAQIAINGMAEGWFTGKKLSDYLNDDVTDYLSSRKIINGTDKAELIAAYALDFETAFRLAHGVYIPRQTVMQGSRGDDVRELQLLLSAPPDGVFGPESESRLKAFQQQAGITADGICGQMTWSKLEQEYYNL